MRRTTGFAGVTVATALAHGAAAQRIAQSVDSDLSCARGAPAAETTCDVPRAAGPGGAAYLECDVNGSRVGCQLTV